MSRQPVYGDMDVFEYLEIIPVSRRAVNKITALIKQREAGIHTRAKVGVLLKAQTITKYLNRAQRDQYFKDELEKARDEGIELNPVKKMKISDV